VSYEIPRGCLASYFPETNVLVPIDSFAEGSHTPTSKSVIVSLVKATQVQATQVNLTQAKATVGN
jgi:hypothetical protein